MPMPFVSDPNGEFASELRIVGDYLYWMGSNYHVVRAPLAGGAGTTLFTHPKVDRDVVELGGLTADDSGIYFTDEGDTGTDGVYKLALDGAGGPMQLAVGRHNPTAIAVTGDDLVYIDGDALRHVKKSGAPVVTMALGVNVYNTQVVIDGGYVYLKAEMGDITQHVYRIPLTAVIADEDAGVDGGTAPLEKISVVGGRYEIALSPRADQGYVYWIASGSFFRSSTATNTAEEVTMVADPPRYTLYAYAGTIYWAANAFAGGGTVYKQAVQNGMPEVVASIGAASLVADDRYLYVASGKDIYRFSR
jgi:hypothetical protein